MYYGTPPIVTNGLVLHLDTLNPQSIPLDPTINNIKSQSGSMAPVYINPATMSVSWSAANASWYVTFKSGSTNTPYKGIWCTLDKSSPYAVLEPTSSQVVFSFKMQSVTNDISMSIDLNNGPYSGSAVSNDNRSQEIVYTVPVVVTTSSVSTVTAVYTVQTGSANFTGSYYHTFNSIYAVNGFPITQDMTIRIWDIQHELGSYQTPFTEISRSIWYDLSGNNNHAQLIGNARPIPKYNSLNQRILNFDGTGSYISTPYITPIGTGSYTYSTWIKFSTPQVSGIISKRLGTPTFEQLGLSIAGDMYANTTGSQIVFNDVQNLTSLRLGITPNSYNDNKWHYLTLTRTVSNTSLYIDGILTITNTSGSVNQPSNSKLHIGVTANDQNPVSGYFNGSIGHVQVYNRALSAQEVLQNYNATKTRYGLT